MRRHALTRWFVEFRRWRFRQLAGVDGQAPLRITPVRVLNTWWDLVCAAVLLLPTDTFGGSPGYREVLQIVRHDWTVGWALLIIAAARLVAMFHPLPARRREQVAAFVAMSGFMVWMIVAGGIFVVAPFSLGSYAYLGIAAAHAWSYVEARTETR